MVKFIALLRGINVGGHRKIRMKDLRSMFDEMGFENVVTYIQSGNVVFDAPKDNPDNLSKNIEQQIEEIFGHEVPVIIRTREELDNARKIFAFNEKEGWRGYITFLKKKPKSELKEELEAQSSGIEKFRISNRELYSFIDKQAREQPLFSNNFVEKKLDTVATTRNLRTVEKLLELAALTR